MNRAYILLGTNMGNKLAHLQMAIELMNLQNILLMCAIEEGIKLFSQLIQVL